MEDALPGFPEGEPLSPLLPASVVVATRQRPETLRRCLSSLSEQAPPPAEIIVVDNSAGDAATQSIASTFGADYLLVSDGGLAVARNAGARHARGTVVLFIDDDAIAAPGWIAEMVAAFDDRQVGAATGRVLAQGIASAVQDLAIGTGGAVFLSGASFRLTRADADWFQRAAFGGMGVGCNMAFRRTLFDDGVEFNPRTGRGAVVAGNEEHLAFLHVLQRGFAITYVPGATVHHSLADSEDVIRRNYLRDLSVASGFMTLLLVEEPSFRSDTLRYAWGALRGVPRLWRVSRTQGAKRRIPVSRARAAAALAWGPLRYLAGRAFTRL